MPKLRVRKSLLSLTKVAFSHSRFGHFRWNILHSSNRSVGTSRALQIAPSCHPVWEDRDNMENKKKLKISNQTTWSTLFMTQNNIFWLKTLYLSIRWFRTFDPKSAQAGEHQANCRAIGISQSIWSFLLFTCTLWILPIPATHLSDNQNHVRFITSYVKMFTETGWINCEDLSHVCTLEWAQLKPCGSSICVCSSCWR